VRGRVTDANPRPGLQAVGRQTPPALLELRFDVAHRAGDDLALMAGGESVSLQVDMSILVDRIVDAGCRLERGRRREESYVRGGPAQGRLRAALREH
jgi:hypothetical protein